MQETVEHRSDPHRRSRPGGERRGDRAPPADARLHHRDRARQHGARRRRPLACRAGAADRSRRHRARLRLRPPAGRRRLVRRVQRRPVGRARARHGRLLRRLRPGLRVRRLARPPARPHRHRRRARRGRRRRRHRGRRHDPPRRLLLLALPPRLARAPGQRARGRCSTSPTRCCARSAPSCSSCATRGSRRSATTTSCSTARTPRWTTASASPRPAASACFEPTVRARALRAVDGEPDEASRDEQRLRLKHSAVNFYRWTPEVI